MLWLAGAMVIGGVLRFWFLNRIAIEHFDEGVYASNFWFGEAEGYEYPARFLYAPPLLPIAIEWTMILASLVGVQPTGWIPVLPCLLAGLAMIPSIWWISRRWFGPVAGTVSAWLVATSDFHASYSRAALTDVPVCLLILWGIYFTWASVQTPSKRNVLLAGLFTGLAWSTKYNGWFPIAVGLSGGIAAALFSKAADNPGLAGMAKRWFMVACASSLVWSPVLLGLQQHGGYQVVAANHRQYVGSIGDWGSTAIRQLRNIGVYDNLIPMATDPLISIAATWQQILGGITPLLLLAASFAGLGFWIWRRRASWEQASAGWFALAWVCGLTVATPFYHPYPRLVLPWLTAVWIGVAVATQLLAERTAGTTPQGTKTPDWCRAAFAVWLTLVTITHGWTGTLHCWQDRTELVKSVGLLATAIKTQTRNAGYPEDEAIVYVYGNPPIVFGLKSNGLSLVGPIQNLDFLKTPRVRPTFLIRTDRTPLPREFLEQWAAHESELVRFENLPTRVSRLVQLDDRRRTDVGPAGSGETIEAYLVR